MESNQAVTGHLSFPGEFALEHLHGDWEGRLFVHAPESSTVTLWDTFEWQLWFGGHVLFSSNGTHHLCFRDGGWIGTELAKEDTVPDKPRFAKDFQIPAMRGTLAPLLGLRGLAPVGTATFRRRTAELRNEMQKIICRFEWLEVLSGPKERDLLVRYCRLLPLLGYDAEAASVSKVLQTHGAEPAGEGPLDALLKNAGTLPRVYSLRPAFGLKSDIPAREAVGQIVRPMLALARENEARIPGDVDTEFVHDYRICLRKIRSVLSLVKGVYPEADTLEIRKLLGKLARETNRLRDLDVYLLSREKYMALLPPVFREALEEMFTEFAAERASEIRKVSARLKSGSHQRQMMELEAFFDAGARHKPAPNAAEPVGPLVFKRIYKRFRKIQEVADTIEANTPDEVVHELRIEGKKLRYLMEFFAELIPANGMDAKEKQLRRLQGQLGEFNDSSVQQKSLLDYWAKKSAKPWDQTGIALSLGGLVSVLYQRQQEQRGKIQTALEEFCSGSTASLFKQTFKQSGAKQSATGASPDTLLP